ncbi:hypothetical protein PORY_002252 [Pneumocystis oryctolagi]|uniref:Uncharacterized protein n=1 Tax=Pneumocystis oryctolagi TaxID=42067 RepID=A0ACB7C9A4_9ASCO|nr:hypothetical protein PORY_002252 [Pneumocystis oryctolagi]
MIIQRPLFCQKNRFVWKNDPTYRFIKPTYLSPPKVVLDDFSIPNSITLPYYAKTGTKSSWNNNIPLGINNKSKDYDPLLLSGMRNAGKWTAECLKYAETLVYPGIKSEEIDEKIRKWAFSKNMYPSSLNYGGFNGSCCISINNIIAHGVPDKNILCSGDIVNIDIALFVKHPDDPDAHFHGDTSSTFGVGDISKNSKKLIYYTKKALEAGINECYPGKPFNAIGKAIEAVAKKSGFDVSKYLAGHGIGREFHSYPLILHHDNNDSRTMIPGMIFTIEPCLCEGNANDLVLHQDGWSISTSDGSRCAQFEHTVLITNDGVEILT